MIVRIAFAVSVFFGGLGVLAYIALALFVPSGDAAGQVTEPPVERSRALAIGAGIGLVVIALSWGIFDGPFWGGGFFLPPALFVLALVALRDPGGPARRRRLGPARSPGDDPARVRGADRARDRSRWPPAGPRPPATGSPWPRS